MVTGQHDASGTASVGAGVRVRVPAKINLFLAVRGARSDGYHELVSVMQTVGIHDVVTVRLRGGGALSGLHPAVRRFMRIALAHGGPSAVPDGDRNLAVQAAQQLLVRIGGRNGDTPAPDDPPCTLIELHKDIPVAAGMAGGSADAAAALLGCNTLWACDLEADELRALAADLGADVPFCVVGGTALATGTGTATAQVLVRGHYHWVVGMSDAPLPTAAVYHAWDEIGTPSEVEPDLVLQALRTGDAEALGAALHNDLQAAALHLRPDLEDRLDVVRRAGALGAVVSGAGPTVLGLARDAADARRLAAAVADGFDRVEVATSPAGGPDVDATTPA